MPVKAEHKRLPKFHFAKHKGEHKGKFGQFAENVQLLRAKTHHHM